MSARSSISPLRSRSRPDPRPDHYQRPRLEELEPRYAPDATTGVFTTNFPTFGGNPNFAQFGPTNSAAFFQSINANSPFGVGPNDLMGGLNSSLFFRQSNFFSPYAQGLYGPFQTAMALSPFSVNSTAVVLGYGSPATSLQEVGGLPVTTQTPGTLSGGGIFAASVDPAALLIARQDPDGVPATGTPSAVFPVLPTQITQWRTTGIPTGPDWSMFTPERTQGNMNPSELQLSRALIPIANLLNPTGLPLLPIQSRVNNGGPGETTPPAGPGAPGGFRGQPEQPTPEQMQQIEQEMLDFMRAITYLDLPPSGTSSGLPADDYAAPLDANARRLTPEEEASNPDRTAALLDSSWLHESAETLTVPVSHLTLKPVLRT